MMTGIATQYNFIEAHGTIDKVPRDCAGVNLAL